MIGGKLLSASAAVQPTYIEDVFSTYLFTGTGAALTINNGIDLAGEGGLVWQKSRTNAAYDHNLFDTARGVTKKLLTNTNLGEITETTYLTAFNANGFSVGSDAGYNQSGAGIVTWTFRQAPRFFDVVTYTGDGVAGRQIAHNLGCEVGFMVVKCTSATGDWYAYHRTLTPAPETDYIFFNQTGVAIDSDLIWNDTLPTSTHFTLGTNTNVNGAGKTFVAYLFAHDPLGPSGDGSDGLIACGTVGTNGTLTDLGWEPQWVLLRNTGSSGSNWVVVDNMRGIPSGGLEKQLNPNLSDAETDYGVNLIDLDPRGFVSVNAQSFRYIAIRRGPMREPTVGTEVFDAYFNSSSVTLGQSTGVTIVPDFVIARDITAATRDFNVADRLRGAGGIDPDASFSKAALYTNTTGAEVSDKPFFDIINKHGNVTVGGEGAGVAGLWGLFLKRAPGFFDVVAYTGNGVAGRTVSHNLGVKPDLMIFKSRTSSVFNWEVALSQRDMTLSGNLDYAMDLNNNTAANSSNIWNYTDPTETNFTLSGGALNLSAGNYIAYLFASCPGVSKVGSYTGNGSSQTINCGFTTGARFILIKRTDSTGDWYVWDTARGIVAGNDPHLSLNTTAAEVTTDDTIDPANSGFIVNQVAATNVNVNAATYIYLAIA